MKTALGAAFLAGFAVMALEILSARWLAPAFGFTLTTWAFLISATLLAGAIGAALGRRLARGGGAGRDGIAFLVGALFVATDGLLAPRLVETLLELPLTVGALVASVAILLPAVGALAAVMPLVSGRAREDVGIGRVVGGLVAASTLGSLAGTLSTALVLIPGVGLRATALGLAAILAAFGAIALLAGRARIAGSAIAVLVAATIALPFAGAPADAIVRETPYGRLVARQGLEGLTIRVDGVLQASGPRTPYPGQLLARGQLFELLPWLHPAGRDALHVGLGAGLVPRCLDLYGIRTESIEVNPVLVEVVRAEAGFDGPVRVGDGRAVLRRLESEYDFVILDVFQGEALPAHLLTREAIAEAADRLRTGGVLLVHLIGKPDHPVTAAVAATLGSVFPNLLAARNGVENELQDVFLFASRRSIEVPPTRELAEFGWIGTEVFTPAKGPILTDDRNPLDRLNEPLARELRRMNLRHRE